MAWKVLTVLSLMVGVLGVVPWMGAMIANTMAFAALFGSFEQAGDGPMLLMLAFMVATTLWPLSWLLSLGMAIAAWMSSRPGLAFGLSLTWLAWIGLCAGLFVLVGLVEQSLKAAAG